MTQIHQPVLLDQVLEVLNPQKGEVYFDGTAGYGGHAAPVLDAIGEEGRAVLVDRDTEAVRFLSDRFDGRAEIIHADFLAAAERLEGEGVLLDVVLLDLGVSSPQLDNLERGFSFKGRADLDMRMDRTQRLTAASVVNTYSQSQLERIIRDFGEERRFRAVARSIVASRPITTTSQLAEAVRKVVGRSGDIDPATRTFQAIRIEVNSELTLLEQALPRLVRLLRPGGRIAVISFHSLEDRVVKQFFDLESRDCICPPKIPICVCGHKSSLRPLTPKPLPGSTYDAFNPRARSAKLRAAEKKNPGSSPEKP